MPSATFSVDLAALAANYQLLRSKHTKNNAGAVVKANAYGLGMPEVAKTLAAEGCKIMFVATLDEAIELRTVLPNIDIAVFNGIVSGEEKEFAAHRIIPVVNDLSQLPLAGKDYILHIDTGMTRLGLSEGDLEKLPTTSPRFIMSHLACADDPSHPQNQEQLTRMKAAQKYFPNVPVSFVNSAGLFLGSEFHFDLARPGCAIYGINPTEGKNPMRHVATLSAPILQIRETAQDGFVGYDSTYKAKKGTRIAIAGLGYSDGYFRSLSNRGFAYLGEHRVPIIGIISMDMMALDVSSIPENKLDVSARIEFINEKQPVDMIAQQCDTIGYEVFTRIGRRVRRIY